MKHPRRFGLPSPRLLAFAALLGLSAQLTAQRAPAIDTLKQVLEKRLQKLRPEGMTERNVLFQDVRAGRPRGASYPFQVTAVIRDYGPGYPSNRYYGQTCVGRMNESVFTLEPDEFGGWSVQGAMTVTSGPNLVCKNNPAAGVSAMPLNTLSGAAAPRGTITPPPAQSAPAAAQAGGGSGVPPGAYECWGNGQARLLLNFTAYANGSYRDSEGKMGAISAGANGRVTFRGGMLDGVMPDGFYAVYHAPQGLPTVSFRSARGSEASFCEKKR